MQSRKNDRPKTPQIILLLRTAAGAYLLYLAWSLREDAFTVDGRLILGAVVLFALAGAALVITSVRLLARGDFLRPGETEESPEDSRDEEE